MVNPLFLWPFSIAMFVYQRVMDQCLFIICFHSKTHVFAVGFCSRKLQLPHWPGRQESCSLTDPLLRSPEWLSLHRSSRLHRVYIHKHPHGMWPFVCVCVYLCIYILIYIYICIEFTDQPKFIRDGCGLVWSWNVITSLWYFVTTWNWWIIGAIFIGRLKIYARFSPCSILKCLHILLWNQLCVWSATLRDFCWDRTPRISPSIAYLSSI